MENVGYYDYTTIIKNDGHFIMFSKMNNNKNYQEFNWNVFRGQILVRKELLLIVWFECKNVSGSTDIRPVNRDRRMW